MLRFVFSGIVGLVGLAALGGAGLLFAAQQQPGVASRSRYATARS